MRLLSFLQKSKHYNLHSIKTTKDRVDFECPNIGVGNVVLIDRWFSSDDDHCYLYEPPDNELADYAYNNNCDCCHSEMIPIAQVFSRYGGIGLQTSMCPECEFIYKTRNLSSAWYDEHFRKNWLSGDHERESNVQLKSVPFVNLKKYIGSDKKVLDVGCGLGDRLLAFQAAGHAVFGCEPSLRRSNIASEKLRTKIENTTGEQFFRTLGDNEYFDVVTFFTVLAFVERPFSLLKQAVDHLNENGIIYIRDGNFLFHNIFQSTHLGVMRSFISKKSIFKFAEYNNLEVLKYVDSPCEFYLRKTERGSKPRFPASEQKSIDINKHIRQELHLNKAIGAWVELSYGPFRRKCVYSIPECEQNQSMLAKGEINLPIKFLHTSKAAAPLMLK